MEQRLDDIQNVNKGSVLQKADFIISAGDEKQATDFCSKLIRLAAQLEIEISDKQAAQLYQYYMMLIETNRVMNLTAITDEDEVILKHFIDSLSIVKCLDSSVFQGNDNGLGPKIIDIGTGAGFPGLVLKIVFPALRMTLFDSLKKRLTFLDEVISGLGLDGVCTVHGRAEDFGHDPKFREKYNFAVSRAVANMATLSEYCLPFVRSGGCFIAYKTSESDDEISSAGSAIRKLGAEIESHCTFTLPESDIGRNLVVLRKKRPTDKKYPRKAGVPSRDPLK